LGFVNGLPSYAEQRFLQEQASGGCSRDGSRIFSDAINNAFKTIEDAVMVNLLNPNAGLDKATQVLNQVSNVLNQVKTDIRLGRTS